MKLVIGGAFQGKLAWAKKAYGTEDGWIDGRTCSLDEIASCRGIHHFHEYIKRMLADMKEKKSVILGTEFQFDAGSLIEVEQQAERFASVLLRENPDILVVSNELGYGVVPIDQFDRSYREMVGRVCTALAAQAEEMVRVVCGIGTRVK